MHLKRHLPLLLILVLAKASPARSDEAPAPKGDPGVATKTDVTHADSIARSSCKLSVPGMHCGGCAARVKRAIAAVAGVDSVDVNLDSKEVVVAYDGDRTTPEAVCDAASKVYSATLLPPKSEAPPDAQAAALTAPDGASSGGATSP